MDLRPVVISSVFLFLFAVVGTAMVAYTFTNTEQRIADNERMALLRTISDLIPEERYDNDVFHDIIEVRNKDMLGSDKPVSVYRARKDGWPVAAILSAVAPDGYNGNIHLLVAIDLDGTLAGVRVLGHRETPGLGDAIEIERSGWIRNFTGRSLRNPASEDWKVKRDGGVFDQFTGATITPRAVVKAVHKALVYFAANKDRLFRQAPDTDHERKLQNNRK
jgi:electron transport complex protein RnfG